MLYTCMSHAYMYSGEGSALKCIHYTNADILSQLPLPVEPAIVKQPPELVLLAYHLENSPVTADQICLATSKDLAAVVSYR